MLINKVCKYCKKTYLIKSCRFNSKYCSRKCFSNFLKCQLSWNKGLTKETDERLKRSSESLKRYYKNNSNPACGLKKGHKMHLGRKLTEEHKKRIRMGVKSSLRWQKNIKSKERSLKLSNALKGRKFSKEWLIKISKSKIGKMMGDQNPARRLDVRKKISISKIGTHHSKETKEKLSEHWKNKWKNDNIFIEKWTKSQNLKPNKKEKYLIELFKKENLPFKYVGDFTCIIGGKCPDFINKDTKQIIEFFGNYWHKKSEEMERINHFKKYGYNCLVIWQDELNNEDLVLNKIKNYIFTNNINSI